MKSTNNYEKVSLRKQVCLELWEMTMITEKDWSANKCRRQIDMLMNLIKQLQKGYAAISVVRKNSVPKLFPATLVYYDAFFKRPFRWEEQNGTIPFWDARTGRWDTFEIENLLDWCVIY